MGIMFSNQLTLLSEAAKAEGFEVDNTLTNSIKSTIKDAFADIPEIDICLGCTVDMVNVIEDNDEYYVDLNDIAKYMTSQKVDSVKEALTNICYHNNISFNKTNIVVENERFYTTMAESCRDDGRRQRELNNTARLINKIKTDGCKLVKKRR